MFRYFIFLILLPKESWKHLLFYFFTARGNYQYSNCSESGAMMTNTDLSILTELTTFLLLRFYADDGVFFMTAFLKLDF